MDHRPVEVRVELPDAVGVRALDLDAAQHIVPRLLGGLLHGGEVPRGVLRAEVLAGILHRDVRDADAVLDRASPLQVEGEVDARLGALGKAAAARERVILPDARLGGFGVEFGDEVDLVGGADAAEVAALGIALAACGARDDDGRAVDRRRGDARADDHRAEGILRRVFITGHARARGYREVRPDALLDRGFVVAGMSGLLRDIDAVFEDVARRDVEASRQREGGEVAHVGAASAAELVDDEAAPLRKVGGGELHHAEGVGGSRVEVSRGEAHALRAGEDIDLPGEVRRRLLGPCGSLCEEQAAGEGCCGGFQCACEHGGCLIRVSRARRAPPASRCRAQGWAPGPSPDAAYRRA